MFATYFHPHTCQTSKAINSISFVGYSFPHYNHIRQEISKKITIYPSLPVKKVKYSEYLRVHSHDYLQKLIFKALGKPLNESLRSLPLMGIECEGFEYCLPGYVYGLGGIFAAIDEIKRGRLERAYCFCLGGHHAHRNWGHGYCLLNPLATAAKYAQSQGFHKILIIDWDIHHGDGTQSIFSCDDSVYCISIHTAVDIYMSKASNLSYGTTTMAEKIGHCNIPLISEGITPDIIAEIGLDGKFYRSHESLSTFRHALENLPWNPDLIFIFSGYDSHRDDCGKGITDWTNRDFQELTKYVLDLAKKVSCPVISRHGGGYCTPVTISAALSHIEILANYK
ncbi:histone deacetylase [Anabaena catenula]|uniref:Histone deacetylase n=1 Tax=Anabaena catenula FACHB-362 TaxID=2692877 RepID=A0ABR8J3P9_9NOST|nr:histone deacetylase [Anabaena catenula]MBD2692991.1 histone deacetylase [Anabaena catenula FACHB-362]